MRRIKFRMWDDGRMEYDIAVGGHSEDAVHAPNTVVIIEDGDCWYPEEPSGIIMQFTGLHDKNGSEIYEGDILFHSYVFFRDAPPIERTYIVVYWKDGFFTKSIKRVGEPPGILDKLRYCTEFEIIGSIYENPELLK